MLVLPRRRSAVGDRQTAGPGRAGGPGPGAGVGTGLNLEKWLAEVAHHNGLGGCGADKKWGASGEVDRDGEEVEGRTLNRLPRLKNLPGVKSTRANPLGPAGIPAPCEHLVPAGESGLLPYMFSITNLRSKEQCI